MFKPNFTVVHGMILVGGNFFRHFWDSVLKVEIFMLFQNALNLKYDIFNKPV